MSSDEERQHALAAFKAKLIESREWEAKLKALRLEIKGLQKDYDQTEENIKALQSVGQIIGEVLKQLDDERCESPLFPCCHCHLRHYSVMSPFSTGRRTDSRASLQSSSRPPRVRGTSSAAAQKSTRPS